MYAIIENDNDSCQVIIIESSHKGGEKCDSKMQLLRENIHE